jgi:hypothetical protein
MLGGRVTPLVELCVADRWAHWRLRHWGAKGRLESERWPRGLGGLGGDAEGQLWLHGSGRGKHGGDVGMGFS